MLSLFLAQKKTGCRFRQPYNIGQLNPALAQEPNNLNASSSDQLQDQNHNSNNEQDMNKIPGRCTSETKT